MIAPAKPKQTRPAEPRVNVLNRRMGGLRALRQRHQPHWEEIRDYIAPDSYEDPATSQANDGARRDSAIVNNTPTLALEVAVSGLFNGTCDPTERWFDLEAVDPELNKSHAVRVYCEAVTDSLFSELNRSNFYKLVSEDFRSLLGFGTCATVMEEVWEGDAIINFQAMPIGSYFVANNTRREVNEIARDLRMSAAQMVDKFGDNVSQQVADAAKEVSSAQREFPVVHLVYQNIRWNPMQDALSESKPYSSCYYEPSNPDGKDTMLEEKGFTAFPVACARWNTTGANPWGFGCGRTSIGDCRALMAMEIDAATATELGVKPPLLVPSGMTGQPVSLIPGALTYSPDAASDQGVKPLIQVSHDLSHSTQKIQEHESRIERAFYNDIFLMIANDEGGKMTATEINERAAEKRLALTPILRVGEEYHKPILRFLYLLAGRRGRLPEPPPELEGQEIKLTLKSVLFAAAELQRSVATRSCVANAVQVGESVPSVLKIMKWDKIIRDDFRRNGAPADLLYSEEEVAEMAAAEEEAMAKRQQGEAANLAANTAKTLSETNTGNKSALTDIMAGLQQ